MSRLDAIYRRLLLSKFFTRGWGKPDDVLRILNLRQSIRSSEDCSKLVSADHPIHIDREETKDDHRIIEGHFTSPFHLILPDIMPPVVQTAHFQCILPLNWTGSLKPVVLHLAGTGDHFYWRRRTLLALPLLRKYGIGSIILENPYYGLRKPKYQLRSSLHNVSDLFVMGGALIFESAALFHWCERHGLGPLAITGISMGGYMASVAAASWHKPISLIPCLSWTTASCVFTEGVLSRALPWQLLQKQFVSDSKYKRQIWPLITSPEKALMEQVVTYCNSESDDNGVENNSVFARNIASRTQTAKSAKLEREVRIFMRSLMDEFTHLGNFPTPVDTDLVVVVAAIKDAYVPISGYVGLDKLWPGIDARYMNCGHISSFLFKQDAFKRAIHDGFMKQIHKYHPASIEAVNGLRAIEKPSKYRWLPGKYTRLSRDL